MNRTSSTDGKDVEYYGIMKCKKSEEKDSKGGKSRSQLINSVLKLAKRTTRHDFQNINIANFITYETLKPTSIDKIQAGNSLRAKMLQSVHQ